MPDVDLTYALGLSPKKAIEYFKSKGFAFSWDWQQIWQEAHTKAFTVAKVMRMDILQDIRDMLQKSLDEGLTFRQFQKELQPKLEAKGWWGKKIVGDAEGGQQVQLGSPYRLKNIYRTNLQTSFMAGRYKFDMENAIDRPYWMYIGILDDRIRLGHRKLHGLVFHYTDPFWKYFYPPNDWGCRCRVRALTKEQVKKMGKKISSGAGFIRMQNVSINKAGAKKPVAVYQGVAAGAGWSYNPGQSKWFPDLNKYDDDIKVLF